MSTSTLPPEKLFRRIITVDHNARVAPSAKLRPNSLVGILAPIQKYMTVRDGQEQTYRCSQNIEKEYQHKIAPVKYDSPLNDYIRHVPFFRRIEVFPYYSTSGDSEYLRKASEKVEKWVGRMKYLDKWDGPVSDIRNLEGWIPSTLLQPLVSCRRCQKNDIPCVYTTPARLTSLRNIPTSSTGLGGKIATLPSKPDLEPLSQEEFKPVASGELSICLGCKFDGAGCACTFDVGNQKRVRIRPLFYPRARVATLHRPNGKAIHWDERHKYQIKNLQDLVEVCKDSVSVTSTHNHENGGIEGEGTGKDQRKRLLKQNNERQCDEEPLCDTPATPSLMDLGDILTLTSNTSTKRQMVTVVLNRADHSIPALPTDHFTLHDLKMSGMGGLRKDQRVRSGPVRWNMNQTEFIHRLLLVDFDVGPVHHKFYESPVFNTLQRKISPPLILETPVIDDADRARYLPCCPVRSFAATWVPGADCPEKAISGLLGQYAGDASQRAEGDEVIPVILNTGENLPEGIMNRLAEMGTRSTRDGRGQDSNPSSNSSAKQRIMGVIRRDGVYCAFIISFNCDSTKAILNDPFPGEELDIGCRSILEAIINAYGNSNPVGCKHNKAIAPICMKRSDSILESQSVVLALSIISILSKRPLETKRTDQKGWSGYIESQVRENRSGRPANLISMVTPGSLGYINSPSCGDWIRKLENRLVQSQVYQGKRIYETARLLQQELALQ